MTFRDIAIKNFKYKFRYYIGYFLCTSFSIMIFFMYATVLFNEQLSTSLKSMPISTAITSVLVVIGIFSLFFINYAYTTFLRSKYKEIGLYLSLGMTHKDVTKLIRIENILIVIFSLGTGIMAGIVFSRLFFMAIIQFISFEAFPFTLNYKSFLLTFIVFMFIFLLVLGKSRFQIRKYQASRLIKFGRTSNTVKNPSWILATIGIFLLIITYILIPRVINQTLFVGNNAAIITLFLSIPFSLYLIITNVSGLLIKFSQKMHRFYTRNMLTISEINYTFKQNKNILFLSSLLSAFVIFAIGSTFSIYAVTLDMVKQQNPYDIMVVEPPKASDWNGLNEKDLDKLMVHDDLKPIESNSLEFHHMKLQRSLNSGATIYVSVIVVPESEYNIFSDRNINVLEGNIAALILTDEESGSNKVKNQEIKLVHEYEDRELSYDYTVQDQLYAYDLNFNHYTHSWIYIMDDQDFMTLKEDVGSQFTGNIYGYNYNNWRDTMPIMNNLIDELKKVNNYDDEGKTKWDLYLYWEMLPSSKVLSLKTELKITSFNLFIMSFIGVLFFVASGIVLYFKLYNDLPYKKHKFKKLRKIGITEHEIAKMIKQELRIIYFIPLLIASITGWLLFAIIMVNSELYNKVLMYSFSVVIVYFILYYVVYRYTVNKFKRELGN